MVRSGGGIPPSGGGNQKFCWGIFFTGQWEPEEELFWPIIPFSKLKIAFCEYWTSIKTKISMTPVCPKSMKLKQKWCMNIDYNRKCCFYCYWVITWKLLFSGGINLWWGWRNKNLVWRESTGGWGEGGIFPRGDFSILPVGKTLPHARHQRKFFLKFRSADSWKMHFSWIFLGILEFCGKFWRKGD